MGESAAQRLDARTRLIAAATAAFAERGYHATTTRDIAARAGMSPAAVYVHHSSKEELLFLISRQGHDAALDVIRSASPDDAEPFERLHATVHAFARWHAEHHTAARVVQYELRALSPEHRQEIAERRRAIDRHMRDVISAGVEQGVFDVPDVAGTTLALLSLAVDVARWYQDDGQRSAESVDGAAPLRDLLAVLGRQRPQLVLHDPRGGV
ncbi:MAG TPA: TetR/AcrR family transcriptional regulator, partial [Nocardioidaceae bacterium]|nr:TetR/AcrR family transcriptional regulator [Nocardioidaceae bacterium]